MELVELVHFVPCPQGPKRQTLLLSSSRDYVDAGNGDRKPVIRLSRAIQHVSKLRLAVSVLVHEPMFRSRAAIATSWLPADGRSSPRRRVVRRVRDCVVESFGAMLENAMLQRGRGRERANHR